MEPSRIPQPFPNFSTSLPSRMPFPSTLSPLSTTFSPLCLPNPLLLPYNAVAFFAFHNNILRNSSLSISSTPLRASPPPMKPKEEPKSDVIAMFPFISCSTPSSSTSSISSPESSSTSGHSSRSPISSRGKKSSSSPPSCTCHICGKTFSRQWLLQGHIRTHTGEKPFSCSVCHKSFADKSNLRAHVQTHSGVKPHECGRCGKKFALKSYLSKHEESACYRQGPGKM